MTAHLPVRVTARFFLCYDIPILPRKGHFIVASRQMPVGLRNVMEFGYLLSKFGGERKVDPETENYGVALYLSLRRAKTS